MDFSTTELFVEIFIAGALLVFGVSPIIICLSSRAKQHDGLLAGMETWGEWNPAALILAVALMYAVGVGGNRLLQNLYDLTCIERRTDPDPVELAVRDHSEVARDWIERHKTYHKVLRAASFSSFLFLVSMGLYRISAQHDVHQRYHRRHYAAAIVLGAFFFLALVTETRHYQNNLQVYWMIVQQSESKRAP
jgi:hypothetical protein